jgi:hypothetical protein
VTVISRTVLVMMMFLVALTGCASMEKSKQTDGLGYQSRQYAKALRWGDYDAAIIRTRLPEGESMDVDLEYLKNIKVTRAETSPALMSEDLMEGQVILYLDYYHELRNSVKSISVQQTWKYDEEDEQWYVETPFPKFKP